MTNTLHSNISLGYARMSDWAQDDIKNEPMLFNCDVTYAKKLGGPITKEFLKQLISSSPILDTWRMVIDTRVHMLMPGWYPCIPGYHHDDVPRLHPDGQPWYPEFTNDNETPGYYHSRHAMTIVGGTGSHTQFALGAAEFKPVPPKVTVYKQWHKEVVDHLALGNLIDYSARPGDIIFFDARSWHQGAPATEFGWRYFARASWNTVRTRQCTNEVRRQVQVYLENPMEGW